MGWGGAALRAGDGSSLGAEAGGGADSKKQPSLARLGLDSGRLFSVSSRNLFTAMRLFATPLQPRQQPGPRTTARTSRGS